MAVELLDSDDAAGQGAAHPFTVLAFIEANGRGMAADAVGTRVLGWFQERFGSGLPEATRNAGPCTAEHAGRTFVAASESGSDGDTWAYWLDDPVQQVRDSCLVTEALIRSRQGRVDRMGFRLLAEVPSDQIPRAGREAGLAGAIEALCDLYSTATDSASQVPLIRSEGQMRDLISDVLDPKRAKPVIVVSTTPKAERASATRFDARSLAKATHGLAGVCIVASSQSRLLSRDLGRKLATFNGAVRVYLPGVERDTDPQRHQLHCATPSLSAEQAERSWLSLQRLVARESANAFREGGGRLPYEALQQKAVSLKQRGMGQEGARTNVGDRAGHDGGDAGGRTPAQPLDCEPGWLARRWNALRDSIRHAVRPRAPSGDDAGRALGRLQRKLEKAEAGRKRLAQRLGTARQRVQELAAANSRLKGTLQQRDERIVELESALAATKPLPDSWERVAGWCDTELSGCLMLAAQVRRDLHRALYEDVETAARGLKWLATAYRDARRNGRGGDLRGAVPGAEGLSNERCGSDSFSFSWQGETRQVEWHLRRGTSHDPRHCLRVYYFWDARIEQVIVASMPAHRVSPD